MSRKGVSDRIGRTSSYLPFLRSKGKVSLWEEGDSSRPFELVPFKMNSFEMFRIFFPNSCFTLSSFQWPFLFPCLSTGTLYCCSARKVRKPFNRPNRSYGRVVNNGFINRLPSNDHIYRHLLNDTNNEVVWAIEVGPMPWPSWCNERPCGWSGGTVVN